MLPQEPRGRLSDPFKQVRRASRSALLIPLRVDQFNERLLEPHHEIDAECAHANVLLRMTGENSHRGAHREGFLQVPNYTLVRAGLP